MGFIKKIAGIFGLSKEEAHEVNDDEDAEDAGDHHHRRHHHHHHNRHNYGENEERHRPTKGFSVQVPVTVEKPQLVPVITPSSFGNGGVQGLRWYAKRLKIDEDGDVADEFLDEVLPEASSSMDAQKPLPRFEVKYNTRQVKVKSQMIAQDGKLVHIVEYEGRSLLV